MRIQLKDKAFDVAESQYDQLWEDIIAGNWEPQTFNILDYFVGSGDTVLDLGAWIGPVSLYAAQLCSEVYAIEPDPLAFAELEKNIRQNPGLNLKIKCCKLAISGTKGKLALYAREKYGASSSSLLPRIRDKKSDMQVEGLTLREFIDIEEIKKIDFIKIDIEGGEFDLLPSILTELKKMNFPTLFISFHYNYLTEHQYYLKIKCRLISKIMMKLEKWTGVDLFGKTNRLIVLKALHSLKDYHYVYDESGQELSHVLLNSKPFLLKKHNLIFTNNRWI